MEEIPAIETPRLRLVSMSIELLRLLIEGDFEAARSCAGFGLSDGCPLPAPWGERTLRLIEENPEQRAWLMHRAIVRKEDNRMIGHIRFHHKAPDPDPLDYVGCGAELGYVIAPMARRNGYGRESAIAMMEWGHREKGITTFFLSISPANLPSMKLAASMNFRKIGEKIDEVDGPEYIMKAGIQEIRAAASYERTSDTREKHP